MTNARFEDLESRARKLKVKKYLKVFVILFLFLGLSYYASINYKAKEVIKKEVHVVKKIELKVEPKVELYEPIKQEIKKEKKIVKVEEKEVMVEEKIEYNTIKLSPTIILPTDEKIVKIEEAKPQKKIVQLEELEPQKKKKLSLHVKEVKSEEALLERFRVVGDFDSSLALAKLYFQKNSFEKSIYWSKKASKLNSGDDMSWLIYAKSKKALDKTEDAIKALQLYLEYFSSDKVKNLLKDYRNSK